MTLTGALQIPTSELTAKRERLFASVRSQADIRQIVLLRPAAIQYFTGFYFIPTERPLAVILRDDGTARALVPRLELEHMQAHARLIDDIESYDDYPGERPPLTILAEILRSDGAIEAIASDSDGYPGPYGYHGPSLSALLPDVHIELCGDRISQLRRIKTEVEIALLREAAGWVERAHHYLQDAVAPGVNETDVRLDASQRTSNEMLAALGDRYDSVGVSSTPVSIGFRSQIGANSAFPHAVPRHLTIHQGDVLVTGGVAIVGGLRCGIERTMFVGEPSEDQRRFFDLMVQAQDQALDEVRPGAPCSAVDRVVRTFFEDEGIQEYWRHHTGHGVGTELHEPPYLDIGEEETMQPGMVFSVEPGIYVPGLGGFRHQDTVVVTDTGFDLLNQYPRDLDHLICPPTPVGSVTAP